MTTSPEAWTTDAAEIAALAHLQAVAASWTGLLYATDTSEWAPAGGHDPAR